MKTTGLDVRISEKEKKMIEEMARGNGKSISSLIRTWIYQHYYNKNVDEKGEDNMNNTVQ